MSEKHQNIIISVDGQTWHFDRPGSEHEFFTIAGVENAINRVRQELGALKDLGVADQRVMALEKDMKQLEAQQRLAIEGGI
jgi:hypothetical protein